MILIMKLYIIMNNETFTMNSHYLFISNYICNMLIGCFILIVNGSYSDAVIHAFFNLSK